MILYVEEIPILKVSKWLIQNEVVILKKVSAIIDGFIVVTKAPTKNTMAGFSFSVTAKGPILVNLFAYSLLPWLRG